MNFLSHFYLTQGQPSPYYTLGSVLPDLLRIHNSEWKVHLKIQPDTKSPELNELLRGWHLHVESDRLFHNSPYFHQHTQAIRIQIRTILSRKPFRPFFLAHISLELLLDHLLLTAGQVDPELFYSRLEECDPRTLDQFFDHVGIPKHQTFYPFYKNFCQIRYLNDYRKMDNLAYAINQIGKRVWQVPFNDQEQEALCRVLEDYILQIPQYMQIFDTIKTAIKTAKFDTPGRA